MERARIAGTDAGRKLRGEIQSCLPVAHIDEGKQYHVVLRGFDSRGAEMSAVFSSWARAAPFVCRDAGAFWDDAVFRSFRFHEEANAYATAAGMPLASLRWMP